MNAVLQFIWKFFRARAIAELGQSLRLAESGSKSAEEVVKQAFQKISRKDDASSDGGGFFIPCISLIERLCVIYTIPFVGYIARLRAPWTAQDLWDALALLNKRPSSKSTSAVDARYKTFGAANMAVMEIKPKITTWRDQSANVDGPIQQEDANESNLLDVQMEGFVARQDDGSVTKARIDCLGYPK